MTLNELLGWSIILAVGALVFLSYKERPDRGVLCDPAIKDCERTQVTFGAKQ